LRDKHSRADALFFGWSLYLMAVDRVSPYLSSTVHLCRHPLHHIHHIATVDDKSRARTPPRRFYPNDPPGHDRDPRRIFHQEPGRNAPSPTNALTDKPLADMGVAILRLTRQYRPLWLRRLDAAPERSLFCREERLHLHAAVVTLESSYFHPFFI